MVGYWYYKFEIEDRDIGVVDYSPFIDAEELELPVVSVCVNNPFLKYKLQGINSSISVDTYLKYLEGKLYDDVYEQIEYA